MAFQIRIWIPVPRLLLAFSLKDSTGPVASLPLLNQDSAWSLAPPATATFHFLSPFLRDSTRCFFDRAGAFYCAPLSLSLNKELLAFNLWAELRECD